MLKKFLRENVCTKIFKPSRINFSREKFFNAYVVIHLEIS